MNWKVPFAPFEIGDAERQAVLDTLDSGWPSQGPRTTELEVAFARKTGTRHAMAVANGTAALHLALATLDLATDDEVILPSLTFVATANAVVAAGGRPVFADIAAVDDPCLSAGTVEPLISSRTRAVIAVHYAGVPVDMVPLGELCRERNLFLLEDAAHAPGALVGDRAVGSLGDAAAFSFFANKNLTTIEGGMVTTDDDEIADRVRRGRSHGMSSLSWERHLGASPDRDVTCPGLNYRFDDLRAAIGLVQLGRLDELNQKRDAILQRYAEAIRSIDGLSLPFTAIDSRRRGVAHIAPLLVDAGGAVRTTLGEHLEARGIQTSHHYRPVHTMTYYRDPGAALPVTDAFADRELTLPLFAGMTIEQVDLVIATLTEGS